MPGQTCQRCLPCVRAAPFNGGPGNCPAKQGTIGGDGLGASLPSMEGRAIARPNRPDISEGAAYHGPSMEGRAIARPNVDVAGEQGGGDDPSMEGRAIARPNPQPTRPEPTAKPPFNGGPGNCPAKPGGSLRSSHTASRPSMEGRAIARPNGGEFTAAWEALSTPSMEGRAIARPNRRGRRRIVRSGNPFNGGPGNCPAKQHHVPHPTQNPPAFNGGPGNCPAKPLA